MNSSTPIQLMIIEIMQDYQWYTSQNIRDDIQRQFGIAVKHGWLMKALNGMLNYGAVRQEIIDPPRGRGGIIRYSLNQRASEAFRRRLEERLSHK
ncbi:hypothetical protein KBC99_03290 [Candidatus Saccharibacteria bacterium]|nr:hypothetical protein [Candidatus Saccharibacteria bacterium]